MIIGIDFDGTCVTHEFPKIGKEIGATTVLQKLVEAGHKLILFTMRSDIENPASEDYGIETKGGHYLTEAVNWFRRRDIPLFGINENPAQKSWTKSPKPYCHLYIDDAGIGCPLCHPVNGRPHVNWGAVEDYLKTNGIIL